jgi:hypothetical protein
MLPNSYIFTSDGNGIYGMIRVTHVQTVDRINRQRFIQNYAVIPLHYNWDTEIQIDIATYTKHINNKELWGVQLEAFETFFKSLNVPPFLIEKIDSGFLNTYIDSYESLPEQPEVPLEESTATYNAFVDLAPVITGLNRIYILTTSNVNKFYTKLTINDEDCIFLDLTPSYFFKVNTKKWNTNITKQFLEDIRLDQAHILLMTKGAKQFFMSLKVTYLQKYKSQKDMVSSITPIAWPLDYPCDSDMYGLYGVLPFMIKSKQAWGEFGQNVKHFDEISHVLKNIPERTLQVFSNTDQGDKLEMFNYLRTYLTYEAFARANNQFIDFTREQIEQWSDTIHPRDYGLRLRLYWDSL